MQDSSYETSSQRLSSATLDGFKRAVPIVLGYVPVAFAFGVLAVKNDISPSLAILMSIIIFAGSGQFVAASLWGAGVGAASVILTVFVINLRHLLMSASLATHTQSLTRWQRGLLGLQLTDETFGVHSTAFQRGWQLSLSTLYTCNSTAQISWVSGTAIGVFFGSLIEDVRPLGLDYALTAMFLALFIPQCQTRLHVLVGLFAGGASMALKINGFDQWNVILATVLAATLGLFLSKWRFIRQYQVQKQRKENTAKRLARKQSLKAE